MTNRKTLFQLWVPVLFLAAPALHGWAQTSQGQISGSITDISGATIPSAPIRAINEQTGSVYDAISTGSGAFRFPSLAAGTYTVAAAAPGFKDQENKGVVVQIGTITALNLSLSIGAATETVSVDASAATVETQSSDVGGVITTQQIEQLPLALGGLGQLRAIESFAFLIPGTVGPGTATGAQGANSAQNAGIYLSKLGGGQNFAAQVLLDGLSTQRAENGSTFDETSPSVEAISQFRVTTSTPAAEFGRTSGGIENFLTRSGTNDYHGTAFDIFRNTALDANDYFSAGYLANCAPSDTACQKLHGRAIDLKNDYGVSLGGPIRIPHLYDGKDKVFFFYSFEQFRKKQGTTAQSTVPTALERTGDFSELLAAGGGPTGQINPCTGQPNQNGEIFDPTTNKTVPDPNPKASAGQTVDCRSSFMFGGKLNVINPAQITPLGHAIINAYPLPQNGSLINNYFYRSTQNFSNTVDTIRVDSSFTSKLKTYASYSWRENTVPFGGSVPIYPGPAGGDLGQDFTSKYGRVGVDYVFTSNILNSFIFGTNHTNNKDISAEIANGVNYAGQLGIGGINSNAFPNIYPQNGVSGLGAALNSDHVETHFLINDSVIIQKGRNTFKLGVDATYRQFVAQSSGNANGQIFGYLFETASARAGSGYAAGTGFGLAGLELGLPDYVRYITPQDPKWTYKYFAGYFQDDLKVTPQLTLNLGLRYDVDTPRHEARNKTSNFSPTAIDPKNGRPGALIFATNCNCNTAWADAYYKNIAPRVGFAFSPRSSQGKTVLRGGGAILYAPLLYADFGNDMQQGFSNSLGIPGDGFNAALDLNQGIPTLPALPNTDPAQLDTGNANGPQEVEYIKPSFGRNGMVTEWNLQVQQELARDTIFTVGYIGQVGQNLPSFLLQLNNMPTSALALGSKLFSHDLAGNGITLPYPGFNGNVGQALRPFPQYSNLRTPSDIENGGHTSFNALIASLSHRTRFGLTFDASYTWSKTLTNADSAIGGINGGVSALIQDTYNLKTAKAVSVQDVPNNFVVNYLYELPFGRNKSFGGGANRFVDAAIGGWTVGGIQRYLSGVPISLGCATGAGSIFNNCFSFTQLPNTSLSSHLSKKQIHPFDYLLANPAPAGPNPLRDSIFNGLLRTDNGGYAALQPNPALIDQNSDPIRNGGAFQFGNLPRVNGSLRNFAYLSEDFVLSKRVALYKEALHFEFKTEILNAFNRHNFNVPNTNPYSNNFGIPLSAAGGQTDSMRRIQLNGRFNF